MGLPEGKVAIITGAASGIGRASAMRFAAEGAQLLLADIDPGIGELANSIPGSVAAEPLDASDESAVRRLVDEAMRRFGRLDILFANAGIFGAGRDIFDQETADWMRILAINLVGPALAVKHAAPAIAASGGGAIICTSSIAGLRAGGSNPAYSASKAGVISLVQTSAKRLAGSGVRINAICPGVIDTPLTRNALPPGADLDIPSRRNPMLRMGSADEVAGAALFLASDLSSYVNGEVITIDGGMSALHQAAALDAIPVPAFATVGLA